VDRRTRLATVFAALGAAAVLLGLPGCAPREAAMFPQEVRGWAPDGPAQRYGPDDLYRYIDGAAEVYRALGVRETLAQRYVKAGAPEIAADVFDMGTPEGAFGAYHHDRRDGTSAGIGQESEQVGPAITFWKGTHYVSVMALEDYADVGAAVQELARALAAALPGAGQPPRLLARLPQDGQIPGRVHWFRDHHLLNRYYFFSDENLLGLGPSAEAVLADYRGADEGDAPAHHVLLVRYAAPAEAAAALARVRSAYLADADAAGAVRTESGRWSAVAARGELLAAALDAPSRERALALVDVALGEGSR